MSIKIEIYETMCAYFDGELSLDEEKKFLELVESDPELKKEFEWEEKMIFNSIPQYLTEPVIASDTGAAYFSIEGNTNPEKKVVRLQPNFYKRWAIAATVVAIISIISFIALYNNRADIIRGISKRKDNNPNTQEPFTPPVPTSQDSANNIKEHTALAAAELKKKTVINKLGRHQPDLGTESPQLGQIQEAFLREDYVVAINLSEKPMRVRGDDTEAESVKAYATFYRGIANLELNNDSTAIIVLKKVSEQKKDFPQLAQEALWNLSKAYYKSGNSKEAKRILEELLSAKDFIFAADGRKLLKMITDDQNQH